MRTIVLGGTRFIGRAVVGELVEAGHDVLIVHRGEHEPAGLPQVPHVHAHRRDLVSCVDELRRFQPEGVVDMCAMTRSDADQLPVGAGGFLCSRGYAPELARGIRLALEHPAAAGEVFNLCEAQCAPVLLWMEQIAAAAGAELELERVPDGELPEDLEIAGDIAQHWMASPAKAELTMGWVHADPEACVRASVAWHLEHPPAAPR